MTYRRFLLPPTNNKHSRNGGLPRSARRLFMLVVTTAMFALGLIALVLNTELSYQQFTLLLDSSSPSLWSARRTSITTAVGATLVCTIVSVGRIHPSISASSSHFGICLSPSSPSMS